MASRRAASRTLRAAAALAAAAVALTGCGLVAVDNSPSAAPPATTEATPAPTSTTSTTTPVRPSPTQTADPTASPTRTTPTAAPTATARPTATPTATPTPTPVLTEGSTLHPGDTGPVVVTLQRRLSDLGYWLGSADGTYGHLTTQAVLALQKAAGLGRDGVYGPATRRALLAGVRPASRVGGTGVEIDKARQLLLVVRGGAVTRILNTSTGTGTTYVSEGEERLAVTPSGTFSVFRVVDGSDEGPLGALWRPRYFNGGIAVHGYTSVPAYPASHGCARVSMAAMDMIWAQGLMPIGSRVVVY